MAALGNVAFLASIPEWAWRSRHPVIPEDLRRGIHEMARDMVLPQDLPEDDRAA